MFSYKNGDERIGKIIQRAYDDLKKGIKPSVAAYRNTYGEFHEPSIKAAIASAEARYQSEAKAAEAAKGARVAAGFKAVGDHIRAEHKALKEQGGIDLTLPDRTTAGGKAINPLIRAVRDRDDSQRVFRKSAGEALGADSDEGDE